MEHIGIQFLILRCGRFDGEKISINMNNRKKDIEKINVNIENYININEKSKMYKNDFSKNKKEIEKKSFSDKIFNFLNRIFKRGK